MNNRDLKLYSYMKGKGGSSPASNKCPQILNFEKDISGDTRTSYTTKSYSLNEGDTLIIAVMHRSTLTIPTGFTQIASHGYTDAQKITVMAYIATVNETKSVTVTQASSVRLSIYVWQMKNVVLSEATNQYKSGATTTSVYLDNTYRPTILLFSNVYSGNWSTSNSNELVFDNNGTSYKFTAYALNFGTAYSQQFQFSAAGNEWCTLGIYLTEE